MAIPASGGIDAGVAMVPEDAGTEPAVPTDLDEQAYLGPIVGQGLAGPVCTTGFGSHYGVSSPPVLASLRIGRATVNKGGLPHVRSYLLLQDAQLRYCYEKRLLSSPAIAGLTTISFKIPKPFASVQVTVVGFDKEVDACIGRVVQAMTFPPSAAGSQVSVPLTFRALKPAPPKRTSNKTPCCSSGLGPGGAAA